MISWTYVCISIDVKRWFVSIFLRVNYGNWMFHVQAVHSEYWERPVEVGEWGVEVGKDGMMAISPHLGN